MTEDLPQHPINPYGESKLMFERMLHWYHELHGLEFVAFRYFNAAGATENFGEHHRTESHLIPNVLKVPLGQARILALTPGKQGFYNLGNGDGYSVRQVIEMCEKVTGTKIPAVEKPRRPGDPPKLVASAQRAIRDLGWKPKYPKLEDIVATAWAWHKKHPKGYVD